MNRREVVAVGTLVSLFTPFGGIRAVAEQPAISVFSPRIAWDDEGAKAHPHIGLLIDYIESVLKKGEIKVRQDWFIDLLIELRNPFFRIGMQDRTWDCNTGYFDEPSPVIAIMEGGVAIPKVSLCRVTGSKNIKDGFYIRAPWLPYEARGIYTALGDRVTYDFGWMEDAVKAIKEHEQNFATVTHIPKT